MLVTCSICGNQFMMDRVRGVSRGTPEMAEHKAMHKLQGKTVEWIV